MKRTRRSKGITRKGGKFIFSGAYGCAFKPAIKCRDQATRKNGYISKIMNSKYANIELQAVSLLKSIDKDFKYFVYPDEICSPEPHKTNGILACKLSFKHPVALLSPYGGVNLEILPLSTPEDIPELFEGIVNVFSGLELLHTNNYIHNDIKPPNIVASRNSYSGTYSVRIIDFGIMAKITEYVNKPTTKSYVYYPYDIRLLSDTYVPTKENIDEFYYNLSYGNFPIWTYYTNDKETINIKWVLSLWQKMNTDEARLHVVKQCDVYSLGRTIFELYNRLTGHTFVNSTTVNGDVTFLNAQGNETLRKDASLPLFSLVKKMCDPDPFIRIGLTEAKAEFIGLMPAFKAAFGVKPEHNEGGAPTLANLQI